MIPPRKLRVHSFIICLHLQQTVYCICIIHGICPDAGSGVWQNHCSQAVLALWKEIHKANYMSNGDERCE
jgi:hypothetical protein